MKSQRDILVIDDEQVIDQAVVKICGSEGLSVDTSEDAAAALKLLERDQYRLILCDIMMPDLDGFGFLAALHRMQITTPVIMATGYSTVENAVKSLYCGAIDFMPKPFTADELLSVVHRGLAYGRLTEKGHSAGLAYVPCPSKYYRLGYTSWSAVEQEGSVLVGVSDLFLKTIEGIRSVELVSSDDEVVQGNSCAVFTSLNHLVHSVMCPISGRILEVNTAAASEPAAIEKDPYFQGWLYRIVPSELEYELQHLVPCSSDRV
ncbi:MAG: response regulator [Ignavibacteriales bacterium]|nr:response regulator [Ignavibacteriales bacterium]